MVWGNNEGILQNNKNITGPIDASAQSNERKTNIRVYVAVLKQRVKL